MPSTQYTLLLLLIINQVQSRCSSSSECFVKKLFDFSYPQQGVYNISLNQGEQMLYQPLGYGDFNNDLRTDYVGLSTYNLNVYYYNNGNNQGTYTYTTTINSSNCQPINLYLYDVNNDGYLDIQVWGIINNTNCLVTYIQNNNTFICKSNTLYFSLTSQPTLMQSYLEGDRVSYLMIYNVSSSSRILLQYRLDNYQFLNYIKIFGQSQIAVPFSNPHWNTFIDITNDCYPDLIITNNKSQLQIWIYNQNNSLYTLNATINSTNITQLATLKSLFLIDINYDGAQDLIICDSTNIVGYMGLLSLSPQNQFCIFSNMNYKFNQKPQILYTFTNCTLPQQSIHFSDLNVDGYPQILLLCNNTPYVLYNSYQQNKLFFIYDTYQSHLVSNSAGYTIQSLSFFDVLQNGIIDIMISLSNSTGSKLVTIYNNYLYQNSFYIKGYGTTGVTTANGAQFPGGSFYWINSLGNSQKVALYSQMVQTGYQSLPMPYVTAGLGRSNNYIQSFTLGRLGKSKSWSPIIPNSQLAVFSGNSQSNNWVIKIFIMPTDSIVYVVIVCLVILIILGGALVIVKWRNKRRQEPLLADYM